MKAKQTALRDCGQKSLGEICSLLGLEKQSQALRQRASAGPHGFTIQELEGLAREYGLPAQTVRASGQTLPELPLPFVAHYRDNHFVAVLSREEDGRLQLYDTRVGHSVAMDSSSFVKQWSGLATVFQEVTVAGVRLASVQETVDAMGGCCGLPRNPDDLDDDCGPKCHGMPGWSINPVNMNLVVRDTPMWWDAPYGPDVNLTLTYNSQDSLIAVRPFGDKWVLRYASYLVVDPSGSVKVIQGGGRGENFTPDGSGGYNANARNAGKTLRKIAGFGYRFELESEDGTVCLYDVPPAMGGLSASSLLLSIADKYGTALTITHNSEGAITAISHPAAITSLSPSGTWSFVYDVNGRVTAIDDPFGRQATFAYTTNRLAGQTDMGGIAYGYTYTTAAQVREPDPENPGQFVIRTNELFLNAVITPSGTTRFFTEPTDGINNMGQGYASYSYPPPGGVMWENYRITVTDPMGKKEEHYYDGYSSQFWYRDRNHYKDGEPGTVKTLSHFTTANGLGEISSITRQGGGNVTYGSYTSGGAPGTVTGTDGKVHTYTYNARGKVLTYKDNNGTYSTDDDILHSYTYAVNGLDPTQVTRQIGADTPVTLGDVEYDPVTRDISAIVLEGGLRTEYARNAVGQLIRQENPKGDVTTYEYSTKGWLEEIKFQAAGQPTVLTLSSAVADDVGRNVAETDAEGRVLIHEYDDLNRLVKTTYPDATFMANEYSCCNLTSVRARDGLVTQYGYDALKRLTSVLSPGRRIVTYRYDSVGNLVEMQSGRGERIAWEYDSGNRKIARSSPDGSRLTYGYDDYRGRLEWSRDAQDRETQYTYNSSGLLASVRVPGLPEQSYTYNALGQKLAWSDGDQTTTYTYDASDRLSSVDGPLDNDTLSYTYDSWGRRSAWSYDGATESYTFDEFDRVATVTNPLGTFTPTYDGSTGRISELEYPLSGLSTVFTHSTVNLDKRLTQIQHLGPGSVTVAQFDHTYDGAGVMATWSRTQPGLSVGRTWDFQYEKDRQLASVVESPLSGPPPSPQNVWRHQYDPSGNRTVFQEPGSTHSAVFNSRNQLTSLSGGGATWFRGQV
ncbi:MAG: cysteine peptidase family C39 domain-containing protein, partial [Verrucomicrobium sp.]